MDANAEADAGAQTKADADAIEDYWLNWLNEDLRVADAQATSDEDSLAHSKAAATAKADSYAQAKAFFLLAVKTEGALSDKMKHLLINACMWRFSSGRRTMTIHSQNKTQIQNHWYVSWAVSAWFWLWGGVTRVVGGARASWAWPTWFWLGEYNQGGGWGPGA